MKPTQVKCSEGSINQIPPWTEIQGDIRLTPFYNIDDCLEKVRGYVQEIGNGQLHQKEIKKIRYINFTLLSFSLSPLLSPLPPPPSHLPIDLSLLPTRGPCSKYELDIEEGKFRGKFDFSLTGPPLRVSNSTTLYKYVQYCSKGSNFHHFT